MPWYQVIKTINGRKYLYLQMTYRDGGKVKTKNKYLGPASGGFGAGAPLNLPRATAPDGTPAEVLNPEPPAIWIEQKASTTKPAYDSDDYEQWQKQQRREARQYRNDGKQTFNALNAIKRRYRKRNILVKLFTKTAHNEKKQIGELASRLAWYERKYNYITGRKLKFRKTRRATRRAR